MNVLMSGGTGMIGSRVAEKLASEKHNVFIMTRTPEKYNDSTFIRYIDDRYPVEQLPAIDAVINLAGESLFGYWSSRKKQTIIDSRLKMTQKMVDIIRALSYKPKVLISASAIGYYGTSNNHIFTEKSLGANNDFLSHVTHRWELIAQEVEQLNIRTIYTRFGVVLDKDQGAFPLMVLPFRLFVGGPIGNGREWISWVHIDDCVNMILFALTNNEINGPLNITAPHPIRNKELTHIVAKTLRRPAILPVPKFALKLVLGEMSELVTKGQYVLPQKSLDKGYTFTYPTFQEAANVLLK